ncbi:MAG: tRNA uridine-5-carboxymethylaminomethyl(34) synthesis GTPase MnmE [Ruthenibacterium sp.]
MEHTIAALATPAGTGGIAVVRLSGQDAYEVAARVFVPKNKAKKLGAQRGYTALFGHFCVKNVLADEVVALCFRAPHSYTGEDVVELSCHGGSAVSEQLLRACYAAGAKPADAGEFTKRAYLNGRVSLTQAEAVMELIQATSQQGAAAAAAGMEGALYAKIKSVQEHLITLSGHLAAFTDYPEEDVPELSLTTLCDGLQADKTVLDTLIAGYDTGAVLRRGVQTAIVGSPNVGKSTLLNLLSGFSRAIVTPVAGTTRDVVEQEISLSGVRLLLADTAGLRETEDIVEAEGIRRTRQRLARAGLVLAVFDASQPVNDADIRLAQECENRPAIAILNKTDLPQQFCAEKLAPYFYKVLAISAKDAAFLPQVEAAVLQALGVANLSTDAALLANERQLAAAKEAQASLADAIDAVHGGFTLDAAGVCMDDALRALYALTGEDASEDVITEVFSKFCVGK